MTGHQLYQRWAAAGSRIYSSRLNPPYHLGAMAIFMFIVACVSGIYVFLFYTIDPQRAYDSVQQISANPVHAWMRSIHRYSSDLLVVFILLHFGHTLLTGKFRRILSWITGIVSFLVVIFIGVTGFILVWDQKAKLIGFLTAKFLTAVPVFDPAIAGAFLINNLDYLSGFFKVSLFGHIFFSLLIVIILWLHVARISKPKIFLPRALAALSLGALAVVCVVFPVQSDPPAQVSFLPHQTTFDWYYFFGYYFLKIFSTPANWALMLGSGTVLALLPYYWPRRKQEPSPVALIDLAKCVPCNLCAFDCPYEAIDMLFRDGERRPVLDPAKCVGCGICIGSCKDYAISLPGYPAFIHEPSVEPCDVTVFYCAQCPAVALAPELRARQIAVPCIGSIYPKDVEHLLDHGVGGVVLLACEDCYYRQGKNWAVERFTRERPPAFSKKYAAGRVALITFNHLKNAPDTVYTFVQSLKKPGTAGAANALHQVDWLRPAPVAGFGILLALFLLAVPLSNTRVRFFPENERTLLLSFKYASSATATTTLQTREKHMQSKAPMVTQRSPVRVTVIAAPGGEVLFQKTYVPRGLRQDISIYVYAEIQVPAANVRFVLEETGGAGLRYELPAFPLSTADATVVSFVNGRPAVLRSATGLQE